MNKVIEEIKEFIISLSGGPESAIEEMAEDFYDRIAPEFSEETDFEVRSILAEFSTVTAMSQDEAVDKIKRLFEGEKTHWKEDPDGLCPDCKEVHKGGCPTCGGRGIPGETGSFYETTLPCPDCGGTGERRKGERRELRPTHKYSRSGKERREGEAK